MPFVVTANHGNTYGKLAKYADPRKRQLEEGAYESAVVKKYEQAD